MQKVTREKETKEKKIKMDIGSVGVRLVAYQKRYAPENQCPIFFYDN